MKLTQEIIMQVVQQQWNDKGICIECEAQYFHKPFCLHGVGLSGNELVKRLKEREKVLDTKSTIYCYQCRRNKAEGTLWVAYHNHSAILTATPFCESCSSKYSDTRPFGFLPNLITHNILTVQKRLSAFLEHI